MPDDSDIRLQVACSKEQGDILSAAARADGFTHHKGGRSAWILSSALAAAAISLGGGVDGAAGDLARSIREDAEADGLTVEAWLERALRLSRIARQPPDVAPVGVQRRTKA
jgi:hypothetical protein